MAYIGFTDVGFNDNGQYYKNVGSSKFDPYSMNGGSVVAIAGENFSIIGADTRLSTEFSLYTRDQKKLFKISNNSVLGATGCWGDVLALTRIMETRIQMYKHEHNKSISTPALAQMLATMLYYKRFFPYYVLNILAGIDEEGNGCIFSYDPVGHCEKSTFRAGGTAGSLLQPLLDNQIGLNNMKNASPKPFTRQNALSLLKDGFTCAAERVIYTGDNIQIMTISAGGIFEEYFPLRKD